MQARSTKKRKERDSNPKTNNNRAHTIEINNKRLLEPVHLSMSCKGDKRDAHAGRKAAATRDTQERETTSAGKCNKQEGQRRAHLKRIQQGSST